MTKQSGMEEATTLDKQVTTGASGVASDGRPHQRSLRESFRQMVTYYGVSFMQTFVEFGVFALFHFLGLVTGMANGLAVACSGTFNFFMNRTVTFRSSSNFVRSVVLFVLLYLWNFAFGTWFIDTVETMFGWSQMLGKIITMCMQGVWGFCLCKWVIFK